jgi:hypothetical protein
MKISLEIVAVIVVGALAAVIAGALASYAATPYVFADESETNTEQSIAQENIGSGKSSNSNCGVNSIDAALASCTTRRGPGGGGD